MAWRRRRSAPASWSPRWRVLRDRQDADGRSLTRDAPARALFRYSLLYLVVLFAALAVDRLAG